MNTSATVLEHQELSIGGEPSADTLTGYEADILCEIAARRPGFCTRGQRRMRFAQYAGVVGLGARALEVLPKVDNGLAPADECRGVFLRLLELAEDMRFTNLDEAGQDTRRSPLLDVFIASFFDSLSSLLRGGLLRRYFSHDDDLPLVRGRILINRQITANALRVDRVACRYDELTTDNDWNRVLRAALRLVRPTLSTMFLRRRWSELWPAFDEVADVDHPHEVFERLSPDRQVARYQVPVQWARWIVSALSPSLRAGDAAAPGLLFRTDQLFERAVARLLRRRLAASAPDLSLRTQVSGTHLAQTVGAPSHAIIGLRPDLMVFSGDRLVLICDTKWKSLGCTRHGYLDPSNGDVHQMLAYAVAFRCENLALIYPHHDDLEASRETILQLPTVSDQSPRLHILAIDVARDGLPVRLGASTPFIGEMTNPLEAGTGDAGITKVHSPR